MKISRLFLIAGYDKEGIIDESFIHQVSSLSKYGDTIVVMDSNCSAKELEKIKPYTLYTQSIRHQEYDFGSYKRAYSWAKNNLDLKKYDFIYLVNDSVYGPLYDIESVLLDLESRNLDAFGLVKRASKKSPHIQSWFIGLRPKVFLEKWFDDFLSAVKKLPDKGSITILYENGFSELLTKKNYKWDCLISVRNRGVYNKVKHLYKSKVGFIKKVSFSRHNGALGKQLLYVLNRISPEIKDAILSNAKRTYGENYINRVLTNNPVKIIYRSTTYFFKKLFGEGI